MGISPSQGSYLDAEQHKHRNVVDIHTSSGIEPTAPAFERTKTVHATVIGMPTGCPAHFIDFDEIILIVFGKEHKLRSPSLCRYPQTVKVAARTSLAEWPSVPTCSSDLLVQEGAN
jgi:hypothetical protein